MFYATKKVLSNSQITNILGIAPGVEGKTFIVQGFGNVGYWASRFLTESGAKLVGVA